MTNPSPQAAQSPIRPALLWLVLIVIGTAWGATGPFSKLSVSEGNHPIGITFWTSALSGVVLSAVLWARGQRLPLGRSHLVFYLIVGFLGTALPNGLSYTGYRHLPVGVMMTVIALVPMMTLMLALPLGIERPDPRRMAGLVLGVAAVALIALPDSSLPDPDQAVWIILPVIVTLSYAAESLYLAARRPPGFDTLTVMCGLSWGSVVLLIPALAATGGWVDITRLGPPEMAILFNTAIHLVAYFGFLWLINQAGPVFAVQVGYVVTGSGVGFGMLVYGERPSTWVWAALGLMFLGLALVKPRR